MFTGTWKTQFGETQLENGKVEGKKFSYTISFNDMTINSNGELINDNEIIVKNERGFRVQVSFSKSFRVDYLS